MPHLLQTRRRVALALVACVFLLHAALALLVPMPGTFVKYNLAAEQALDGSLPDARRMDLSPLYFEISLLAQRFIDDPKPLLEGLQILLVALAAGGVFLLLRRRVGPWIAVSGTLLFAIDRHVLVYERILEPEALFLFLVVGFLVLIERSGTRDALLAGLFAALALGVRPTFLPVFLLVPVALWLRGERGRPWARRSAAVAVPVVLAMLLLMGRAASITGDPRTPVMNPGTVFFEGNNPLSHGTSAVYPPVVLSLIGADETTPDSGHVYYRVVARASTGEDLSVAEVNAFWASRARAFLRTNPRHALELWRSKLVRAFHNYRWHDISTAWQYDARLPLPSVPFALLAALGLFGALFAAADWRRHLLLYAIVFAQLGVMLVFYVSARQRLVLLPVLLVFAGLAIEELRGANRRRRIVFGLLIGLLFVSLGLPNDLIRDEEHQRAGQMQLLERLDAVREQTRDQPLAAAYPLAVEAMASAPWWLEWSRPAYLPQMRRRVEKDLVDVLETWASERGETPSMRFDLGVARIAAGRPEGAEAPLLDLVRQRERVYRGGYQSSEPYYYLGRGAALRGDLQAAIEHLETARRRAPGDPFILAEIVALTGDDARRDELFAWWSPLDAHYLLGRALLTHGRAGEAVAELEIVAQALPTWRDAKVYLAAALGETGRVDEGAAIYLEAARMSIEPIMASDAVTKLFLRWTELHPGDPRVGWAASQVLAQHGRFRIALDLLEDLPPTPAMAAVLEREKERLRTVIEASWGSR